MIRLRVGEDPVTLLVAGRKRFDQVKHLVNYVVALLSRGRREEDAVEAYLFFGTIHI